MLSFKNGKIHSITDNICKCYLNFKIAYSYFKVKVNKIQKVVLKILSCRIM